MSSNRYTCIIAISLAAMLIPLAGGCSTDRARVLFGVIGDVEYTSAEGGNERLEKLLQASIFFNCERLLDKESVYSGTKKVKFVIQLGDIIDDSQSTADLQIAFNAYDRIKKRTYHVIGERDIAGLNKRTVLKELGLKNSYYDFACSKWRFVVLDTTELNSTSQKNWLKDVLANSQKKRQKAIVFGHHPLGGSGEDIKKVFTASGNVIAYISGHDRKRDYVYSDGIYYVKIAAMADSPAEESRSMIWVYKDRLELQGSTNQPWITMPY
jgi:predicted phosphodiesterase